MKINDLITDIHQNAVNHGWWEGTRSLAEIIALIHSEWSEALEEAREGRPLVYYDCILCPDGPCRMTKEDEAASICDYSEAEAKPEGIAVEIIDGCIRILDFLGVYIESLSLETMNGKPVANAEDLYVEYNEDWTPAEIIAELHSYTSLAYDGFCEGMQEEAFARLVEALALGFSWVKNQGLDPLELLLKKHEYNKTRPYKHGKQF